MSNGATVLDEAELQACIAKLAAMTEGGTACTTTPISVFELECIAAFEGTIAPGQPCDDVGYGAQSHVCDGGFCRESGCQPYAQLGESCDDVMTRCDEHEGQWCIDGVCAQRLELGEPCAVPGPTVHCTTAHCGDDGTCSVPPSDELCAIVFP
jgi:hypothetical protein